MFDPHCDCPFCEYTDLRPNPTRAENILEGRGCLGHLEARQVAQSLRRSLSNIKKHKHIPAHVERGIRRLLDQATEAPRLQDSGRSFPSPEQRFSWLEQAQNMMTEFYAQRSTPGRGIRRVLPGQRDEIDPRLGHLFGPEYQTRSIAARRHNPRKRRGPGRKRPRQNKLALLEKAATWLMGWGYDLVTIVWKWKSRSHDIEAYKDGKLYRFYVFRARRLGNYWQAQIAGKDICQIRTWPRVKALFFVPGKGFFAIPHRKFKEQCGKDTFNIATALDAPSADCLPREGYFPRRNPWSGKADVERHNKKCAQYADCRKLWLRVANDHYDKTGDDGQAVIRANTAAKNWLKKHNKYRT